MKRLKKRSDFQRISKQGQAVKTPAFVFLYCSGEGRVELQESRIGFTATKRTVGGAVARNRAKRRLRALADQCMRLNPMFKTPKDTPVIDGVFIARYKILERPFADMLEDFKKALKREGFTL